MPSRSAFPTQHCCQALFILNEPPGLLLLLFWRGGESSAQSKRTSETSQRCDVLPRGLVGKRPQQLQPWKALYRLLLHLGCELLARRRAVLREPWRNRSELFSVANAPFSTLAPRTHRVWRGPEEGEGQNSFSSLKSPIVCLNFLGMRVYKAKNW